MFTSYFLELDDFSKLGENLVFFFQKSPGFHQVLKINQNKRFTPSKITNRSVFYFFLVNNKCFRGEICLKIVFLKKPGENLVIFPKITRFSPKIEKSPSFKKLLQTW